MSIPEYPEHDQPAYRNAPCLHLRFIERGGKTKITLPDGNPIITKPPGQTVSPLRDTLVRSQQWHEWLAQGKFRTVKELADHEGIKNKSYPLSIMALYSLAPDIQEAILTGEGLEDMLSAKRIRHLKIPEDWSLQQKILFNSEAFYSSILRTCP